MLGGGYSMKVDCREARTSLKHNFLKNIIIRADFGGLAESEVGECFEQIKNVLLDNGYDNFLQKDSMQMMFKMFDPEAVIQDGLRVNNIEKHKVYVFGSEKRDRQFQLSNTVAVMMLSPTQYVPFATYAKPFMQIIEILRKKAGRMFLCKRFGVRKQNICILLDELSVIQEYFEPDMFSPRNLKASPGSIKSYQCVDCLSDDYCEVNLVRQIGEGQVAGKRAYQIVLDTDAYLLDRERINSLLSDNLSYLEKMNDVLLGNYLQAITDRFYEKLCQKIFDDKKIKGVERNE